MGKSGRDSGHLKSKCPKCGETARGASLKELAARLRRCCQTPKRAARPAKAVARKKPPLPDFPVELRLDRLISSQNETTYSHWSVHSRDKRDWLSRVRVAARSLMGLNLYYSRWRIVRVYKHPRRELDMGNLVGGAKPLVDTLTLLDVIKDDRPENFSCEYDQYSGDGNYTLITLLGVEREET